MKSLLSVSFLSAIAVAVTASPALVLDVVGPESVVDIKGLNIKTTLTNTGDEPIKLLKEPNSILSTTQTNTFTISSGSGSPTFTGIRVKYSRDKAAASEKGFIVLGPGESVEKIHSLAGAYNFTRSGEGQYKFGASNAFTYVDTSGALQRIQAASNSHQFSLSGLLATPRSSRTRISKRDISFNGCSAEQQSTIRQAARLSDGYVDEALAYFSLGSIDRDQYTEWFGEYDQGRYATVRSHFELIGHHATTDTTYDCSCPDPPSDEELYAYVEPEKTGLIYLCSLFWNAELTGADSQAGTIVHENSHFTAYGDTMDYQYGEDKCRALATGKPDEAIQNADSHEYFVETMVEVPSAP